MTPPRVCTCRSVPLRSAAQFGGFLPLPLSGVATPGKRWPNGSTLRIRNLDLNPSHFDAFVNDAMEWCRYANLNPLVSNDPASEVRVSGSRLGAWAYVGTDAKMVALDQPTVNLGWYDRRTGLHEFGHVLGFEHEHKRHDKPWTWNLPVVYADNAAYGWDKAMVDAQIVSVLDPAKVWATAFDLKSIMLYSYPSTWTNEGVGTPWNTELSELDKSLASILYPGRWQPDPRIELNKAMIANLRKLLCENPKPHPVAFVREVGLVDESGDGFLDIAMLIGLRERVLGRNRVRVWAVTFDGLQPAGIAVAAPRVVAVIGE